MRQRRLFITRNGRFGIGPVDAQSGDVIHVISGCNFPIMLRPRGDKFAVVGEVYSEFLIRVRSSENRLTWHAAVHGCMNGETLARPWYRPWVRAWESISLL